MKRDATSELVIRDKVAGLERKVKKLGELAAKFQQDRDVGRQVTSRLTIENRRLRDALRGVLAHYHAPCDGCWEALGEAHAALGDPDVPVIVQAQSVQGGTADDNEGADS